MIKANIGDEKYTTIKDSAKYFYVFHAVRIVNNPNEPLQQQQHRLIYMQNKRDADNFAKNPKVANYIAAKLIHNPEIERANDKRLKEEAIRIANLKKTTKKKVTSKTKSNAK